jgi:hypothetical protein
MSWFLKLSQVGVTPIRPARVCKHDFRLDEEYFLACKHCGIVWDIQRDVLETKEDNKKFYAKMLRLDKALIKIKKKNRRKHG